MRLICFGDSWTAGHGVETNKIYKEEPFPNMFTQKLREQNEFNNKTFPLIALSSLGDKEVYKSKFFKTHLIKPIKESRLKKICIKLLNEKKGKQKIEPEKDIKDTIDNNELSLDSYIYKNNFNSGRSCKMER